MSASALTGAATPSASSSSTPQPPSSSSSSSAGGPSLVQWLCIGLGSAAAVKTASIVYHLRQCQQRERIVRDLVEATEANMPKLLMPPIIINEADPSASSISSRAPSTITPSPSSTTATAPASTTIRILAVMERRPSLIPTHRAAPLATIGDEVMSSATTMGGLWRKEEQGGEMSKTDRHRLEKVLSRVHVFMQPRWTLSPNMSPACTMLEAFLRLNKIPYTAHIVQVLNNRDLTGRTRATDIPQEDCAAGEDVSTPQPTLFGVMASQRGPGVVRTSLQFMDSVATLTQQKLNELDGLHQRLPFIVYRGEVVTGSYDTITAYLMEKFHLADVASQTDDGTGGHVALAQALRRTMMYTLEMQYKVSFVLEAPNVFARYAAPAMGSCPWWAMRLWLAMPFFSKLKSDVQRSLRAHDLGALTRDQFHMTALRDMEMIEALLRNPDYVPAPVDTSDSEIDAAAYQSPQHHPARFLFSQNTPSREDCVLYAYLMPILRLSDADIDSMPTNANDAIRFAHESDVFADFVERMTTRAFPDFDRMVCLVLGINPAQLFISRYSDPSGGEDGLMPAVSSVRTRSGGVDRRQRRRRGSSATQAGLATTTSPTSKPYEESLRASAAGSTNVTPLARSFHNPSLPLAPPTSSSPPASATMMTSTRAVASPAVSRPSPPPPPTSSASQPQQEPARRPAAAQAPSTVTPAATRGTPHVPKLALPNTTSPPSTSAVNSTWRPTSAPAIVPSATPSSTTQCPPPAQPTPKVRTPAPTAATRATPPPAVVRPSAAVPVVRYTPTNPSSSASAIRKTRPAGLSSSATPRT